MGKNPMLILSFTANYLQLPDEIHDIIFEETGKSTSKAQLPHLRRELFHAVWDLLLDDDFVIAYQHGIAMECGDGVTRRIYLRIYTYSADYPEK